MNQSQTPLKLIYTVVIAIAILAAIGWTALNLGLFVHIYADPQIITAIMTMEGTLIGYLGGILTNTRQQSQPAQVETTVTSTTQTTVTPKPKTDAPQEVIVKNDPAKPSEVIPVAETTIQPQTPPESPT